MQRRSVLASGGAFALLSLSACQNPWRGIPHNAPLPDHIEPYEKVMKGRIGVAVLDTATGKMQGYRQNETFGMCSTFKLPLAAIILREIEWGPLKADQWVPYDEDDMLSYAPVTRKNLAKGGMTVIDLAEAAQKTSDNVAANLLLKLIGGPDGFTKKLRAIGDKTTRLDRIEPEMNLVPKGEIRDTTTPLAMANTVAKFFSGEMLPGVNGEYLTVFGRETLKNWAIDTRTGMRRLRSGLPSDWIAGDKTGTGIHSSMANKHNDVAICWPPERSMPIIIAAYYEAHKHFPKMRPEDDAVLQDIGRWASRSI